MQKHDAIQTASIQRSETYLRYKKIEAEMDKEIRTYLVRELVFGTLFLAMLAGVSIAILAL
jgi:hypothetical protein